MIDTDRPYLLGIRCDIALMSLWLEHHLELLRCLDKQSKRSSIQVLELIIGVGKRAEHIPLNQERHIAFVPPTAFPCPGMRCCCGIVDEQPLFKSRRWMIEDQDRIQFAGPIRAFPEANPYLSAKPPHIEITKEYRSRRYAVRPAS